MLRAMSARAEKKRLRGQRRSQRPLAAAEALAAATPKAAPAPARAPSPSLQVLAAEAAAQACWEETLNTAEWAVARVGEEGERRARAEAALAEESGRRAEAAAKLKEAEAEVVRARALEPAREKRALKAQQRWEEEAEERLRKEAQADRAAGQKILQAEIAAGRSEADAALRMCAVERRLGQKEKAALEAERAALEAEKAALQKAKQAQDAEAKALRRHRKRAWDWWRGDWAHSSWGQGAWGQAAWWGSGAGGQAAEVPAKKAKAGGKAAEAKAEPAEAAGAKEAAKSLRSCLKPPGKPARGVRVQWGSLGGVSPAPQKTPASSVTKKPYGSPGLREALWWSNCGKTAQCDSCGSRAPMTGATGACGALQTLEGRSSFAYEAVLCPCCRKACALAIPNETKTRMKFSAVVTMYLLCNSVV